jgi:hypothetical protein
MKALLPMCAFLAAALIASPVFAKPGDPIQGTSVGLEHDPCQYDCPNGSKMKTNSVGVAVFRNVKLKMIPCSQFLLMLSATSGQLPDSRLLRCLLARWE